MVFRSSAEYGRIKLRLNVWRSGELRKFRALAYLLINHAGFSGEVIPLSWDDAAAAESEWLDRFEGLFRVLFTEARSTRTFHSCGFPHCPGF